MSEANNEPTVSLCLYTNNELYTEFDQPEYFVVLSLAANLVLLRFSSPETLLELVPASLFRVERVAAPELVLVSVRNDIFSG